MRLARPLVFALIFSLGLPVMSNAEQVNGRYILGDQQGMASPTDFYDFSGGAFTAGSSGGRLPLINGSPSLANMPSGAVIDGFGVTGAPWPPDLPYISYWAGTEYTAPPGRSWLINDSDGKVSVRSVVCQSNAFRAICVPKQGS
ncbi:MAG: hypothetical protein LBC79_07005 [Deltaproteobacteria bacterium]|jgi:hypothetical protein|nr:hypothetical protein [Deltaproteobacteria bacterium]